MNIILPPISIVVITFQRPVEIRRTLEALFENLHYSGAIHWIIADDCSPAPYGEQVLRFCKEYTFLDKDDTVRVITPPTNSGWGANCNTALSQVDTDIVLVLEDDYVLTARINIDPLVALLLVNDAVGLIRLDGIAGHRMVGHVAETDISDMLPDYRQGTGLQGKLNYWLLDNQSPFLWIYSNRPHLMHRRFHDFYGYYDEGLKLGQTEENFAHRVKDKMKESGAPALACPLDATCYFDHIGVSYQNTEHDKGK